MIFQRGPIINEDVRRHSKETSEDVLNSSVLHEHGNTKEKNLVSSTVTFLTKTRRYGSVHFFFFAYCLVLFLKVY